MRSNRRPSSRQRYLLLFFDLPNKDRDDQRIYRRFRKTLIREGYVQLQKSVYLKSIRNYSSMGEEIRKVQGSAPLNSDIKIIPFTSESIRKVISVCGEPWQYEWLSQELVLLTEFEESAV